MANKNRMELKRHLVIMARQLIEYIDESEVNGEDWLNTPEILMEVEVKMLQFAERGFDQRIMERMRLDIINGKEQVDSVVSQVDMGTCRTRLADLMKGKENDE
jgi:hypothetical protein